MISLLSFHRRFFFSVSVCLATLSVAISLQYFDVSAENKAVNKGPGVRGRPAEPNLFDLGTRGATHRGATPNKLSFSSLNSPENETYRLTATSFRLRRAFFSGYLLVLWSSWLQSPVIITRSSDCSGRELTRRWYA